MNRNSRLSSTHAGILVMVMAALAIALAWIVLDRRNDTVSIDAPGARVDIRSEAVGEARDAVAELREAGTEARREAADTAADLREAGAEAGREAADTAAGIAQDAQDAGSRAATAIEDAWEAPAVRPVEPVEPKAVLRIGDSDITVRGPIVDTARNAGGMARDAAGAAASGIGGALQRAGNALERSGQDLTQ